MNKTNPFRLCAFTKCLVARSEALRLVRTPDKNVVFDLSGTIAGRSVHIAKTPEAMKVFCNPKKKLFLAHLLRSPIESIEEAHEKACHFCKNFVE